MNLTIVLLETAIISSYLYFYLHKKTRISLNFMLKDNLLVIGSAIGLIYLLSLYINLPYWFWILLSPALIVGLIISFSLIRFWRTPNRSLKAKENELVSPADGNVLYIKKVENGEIPISIKKGLEAKLSEIANTDIINQSCWLVGINITPFDVHKNCAPISGEIILNKHFNGQYLSLKHPEAILRNERNTLVIKTKENELFGVIQTASKRVKRIDSYVETGQQINKGDWFGMIRFGSQVDIIIPRHYKINLEIGQQIYAKKTIIATK